MKAKESNIMTLDQFIDKYYGKIGTKKRDKLEEGYESFKKGALTKGTTKGKGNRGFNITWTKNNSKDLST